jgi:prepilin-type processing-associated H-X9-DG protein/prepilin-type N-terminal cleavage/methylation domain-containing protein
MVPHRSRFTLIELLVVVSVIAILASLLLPALSKARDKARTAFCMNSIKQHFLAIDSYNDEFDSWMPINGYDPTGRFTPNWSGAVAHYTGTRYYTEWGLNAFWPEAIYTALADPVTRTAKTSLLKCPVERFKNVWNTDLAVSYGWNGGPYGFGSADGFNVDYPPPWDEIYGRIRVSRITRPSDTAMIGEYVTNHGFYEYYNYSQLTLTNFAIYHNGGSNVLWGDGHATYQTAGTLTANDLDRRF